MRALSDNVAEWQIESVMLFATGLKEKIEQSDLAPAEKDEQERWWER